MSYLSIFLAFSLLNGTLIHSQLVEVKDESSLIQNTTSSGVYTPTTLVASSPPPIPQASSPPPPPPDSPPPPGPPPPPPGPTQPSTAPAGPTISYPSLPTAIPPPTIKPPHVYTTEMVLDYQDLYFRAYTDSSLNTLDMFANGQGICSLLRQSRKSRMFLVRIQLLISSYLADVGR